MRYIYMRLKADEMASLVLRTAQKQRIMKKNKKRVARRNGCIVWNAHNTVFGSKCSAICAQAVYPAFDKA